MAAAAAAALAAGRAGCGCAFVCILWHGLVGDGSIDVSAVWCAQQSGALHSNVQLRDTKQQGRPAHLPPFPLPADTSQVSGLDPAYLSALQFVEHAESAGLAQQLHAAANNARAWSEAQAMLQRLLPHSGDAQAGSQLAGMLELNTGGREATVRLLLMGAMVGGIDAKSAPLRLKAGTAGAAGTAGLDAALQADLEWLRTQQGLYAAKAQLPAGLLLGSHGRGSSSDGAAAAAQAAGSDSSGSEGGNATSAAGAASHLSWQQQQRMAPLYRLLHKHCTELERMRSAGGC